MNKQKKNVGIALGCSLVALSSVAFAATVPTLGGYLSRGVDSMCYYVDSSAEKYVSYINKGINRWTNSGYSPSDFINMTAVSSNYATDVDYYAKAHNDCVIKDALAETFFFNSSAQEVYSSKPYYFAEITINNDTYVDLTSFQKIGTAAHELGHAFGLSENNNNTNMIMCQLGSGRTVNTVNSAEYAKVVDIYGG